jgi:peptidoglycan/xylan/chitin deacetylase (PgdA/CDA1 family)
MTPVRRYQSLSRRAPPPLALTYHGVADVRLRDDPARLFVRPRDLRRHIDRLRAWGYELTTFGELARRASEGLAAGTAALTFDDGLLDNLETLSPLLASLGAPGTVFVVSGWLGRPHPYAEWTRVVTEAELRRLAAAGLEIGAHTVTHPDLTTLTRQEATDELRRGRESLEEILGRPVDVVAYPYGRANAETVAAAREAGFRAACLTEGEGSWSDPLCLPRQAMANRDTVTGLLLKRHGVHEPVMRRVRPLLRTRPGAYAVGAVRAVRERTAREWSDGPAGSEGADGD